MTTCRECDGTARSCLGARVKCCPDCTHRREDLTAVCQLCDRWGLLEDPNTGETADCDHRDDETPSGADDRPPTPPHRHPYSLGKVCTHPSCVPPAAGTSVDVMAIEPATVRDLARAGRMQREWTNKRNAAIIGAHQAGASLREIAEAVGLSHTAVSSIIKRGN